MNRPKDVDGCFDASNCSTASGITFEAIKEAEKKARELQPTDIPDVYVMTTACYELIKKEILKDNPSVNGQSVSWYLGIPIEHFPSLLDAYHRTIELRESGKSVALISQ
jgi:hypothetical protein